MPLKPDKYPRGMSASRMAEKLRATLNAQKALHPRPCTGAMTERASSAQAGSSYNGYFEKVDRNPLSDRISHHEKENRPTGSGEYVVDSSGVMHHSGLDLTGPGSLYGDSGFGRDEYDSEIPRHDDVDLDDFDEDEDEVAVLGNAARA